MVVYVGMLMPTMRSVKWRWDMVAHLYADDDPELIAFAERIGLRAEWHQSRSDRVRKSHFDLTPAKRASALSAGAKELTLKEEADIIRQG